jgi:hypothetical protein
MIKNLIKIAVSALLLAALAYKLDWSEVGASLSGISWWYLPIAVALQMLSFVLGNVRWWLLLRTHRLGHRLLGLLPQYFVGAFFNNVLPSSTGGDLLRMYYVYRQRHGAAVAASPVLTERLLGLVTIVGIATVALPFLDQANGVVAALAHVMPWLCAGAVAGLIFLGCRPCYYLLHNFLQRWSRFRIVGTALKVAEASHTYLARPGLVLRLIALSLAIQAAEILLFYSLGTAVGANLEFWHYVLIVPLLLAAAAIPVSIGGLGVREAAAITLFTSAGMGSGDAAAVSLLFIPILLAASLPGLYFFLTMKDHERFYEGATQSELAR